MIEVLLVIVLVMKQVEAALEQMVEGEGVVGERKDLWEFVVALLFVIVHFQILQR